MRIRVSESKADTSLMKGWLYSFIIYIFPLVVSIIILLLFGFVYPRETPHYYLINENYYEVKEALGYIYTQ